MLKKVKEEKENLQSQYRKIDKYQYFPFVGSDTVEQYRKNINTQLKDDLKSFLNYKTRTSKSSIR